MNIENTKYTEQRYLTSNPELMYNRYFASNVYRTYEEAFCDESTGEIISIERKELLFERGTHIDGEVIAKVRFYLSSGDIKEVDVSNQQRLGLYSQNSSNKPYIARVQAGGKKFKVLLYATGLQCVLDIIQDFGELNFNGWFEVVTAKEIDYADIFIDTLQTIDLTEEYLRDEITLSGWAAAKQAEAADKKEVSLGFWRLDLSITAKYEQSEDTFDHSYIVQTTSVERALAVIETKLHKLQEEAVQRGDKSEKAAYVLKINSATPMKIDYVVPVSFSAAHYQAKQENK